MALATQQLVCIITVESIATCKAAMQGHPIHLWDALSGQLRASYRVYNAADEVTAACSIAFDAQGQRLYAGLNNRLCIFDVARPGRYCKNIVPHTRASPGLQGVFLLPGLPVTSYSQTLPPSADHVQMRPVHKCLMACKTKVV